MNRRRALALTLAPLALLAGAAGCSTTPSPEDTAVDFIQAMSDGNGAEMCELAERDILECDEWPQNAVAKGPDAGETFENETTGSTAVLVTVTYEAKPSEPEQWAIEVNDAGKVAQFEDVTGSPATREVVADALEWSE